MIDILCRQVARIQPFQIGHTRIVLDPWMHLPVPDIDGGDVFSTTMKQHLGKTTSRSADIKTVMALRVEPEMIERGCQLEGGAGDVSLRGIADGDLGIAGDGLARFGDGLAVDAHGAARNRVACTRAAGKVAERHKKLVKPFIFRCFGHGSVSMTAKLRRCKRFIAETGRQCPLPAIMAMLHRKVRMFD
ncbi:hypothetical protein D3C72_1565920 [compost metagenome]